RAAVRPHDTTVSATPLTDAHAYFDGLGRVIMQKQQMPDGSNSRWQVIRTKYDEQSQIAKVSAPEFATTADYDAAFTPHPQPSYTGDALDGIVAPAAPDGHHTGTSYTGSRFTASTVKIAQQAGEVDATTTQEYDVHGRLIQATEANGTKTNYTYDQ